MPEFLSHLIGLDLNELSEFSDPFKKECIVSMTMAVNKAFNDQWICSGRIHFQNGNTGGHQEFSAPTLPALLKQMQLFAEGL